MGSDHCPWGWTSSERGLFHRPAAALRAGRCWPPWPGVTDSAFRGLCLEQGAALVYTEMVSAKALCYNDRKTAALLHVPEDGRPVSAQIFGHEPQSMAEGAKRRAGHLGRRDNIDINMGCPVGKVVKSGDGSALMKTPELAAEIVAAVAGAVPVPVTVKIRKGWDGGSVNAVELSPASASRRGRRHSRPRQDAGPDVRRKRRLGRYKRREARPFACRSSQTATFFQERTRRTYSATQARTPAWWAGAPSGTPGSSPR